jgi:2-oxoglutarate ferredoxin oxidoreductase subunit delta
MSNNRENQEVKINQAWCKGCGICVAFCPKQVLGLNEAEKIEMVDRENCIVCGQCELRCPDFAIFMGGKDNE